ncbi:MAG: hypothetical protein K2X81_09555, partial [Candidatus Obscuribacterales bacterium]|nr:hypothetical protein [Candidatus Obscuribacterales bacterium]
FGKGDYSSSLDQRLSRLEIKVLGAAHSGTDSQRLRAVCSGLGIESQDKPSLAAPFAVVVKKPVQSNSLLALTKSRTALQSNKQRLGKQFKAQKPLSNQSITDPVSSGVWSPISQTAKENQELAAKQAESQFTRPAVQEQVMQTGEDRAFNPFGVGIIAAFAFLCASLGTVVYLLFNVKNESAVPFRPQYEYDYESSFVEENGEQQSQIETLVEEPHFQLASFAPVFESEPVATTFESVMVLDHAEFAPMGSILIPDAAQLQPQAAPELSAAEPGVYSAEWEESLSKTLFYELADIPDNVLLNPNCARFNSKNIVGMSIAAHTVKIESDFVAAIEQKNVEVANVEAISFELPALLSVNVSKVLEVPCSTTSVDEPDNVVYAKWPSYEPPLAPRLSTVAVWYVRSEAEKRNRQANDPSEEITLRLQAITEFQDDKEAAMNDDLLNREWECDTYKAFAQLLIDAAQHCAVSAPEAPLAPTVNTSRKINATMSGSVLVAQGAALRQVNPEIERHLRTLFSEAS